MDARDPSKFCEVANALSLSLSSLDLRLIDDIVYLVSVLLFLLTGCYILECVPSSVGSTKLHASWIRPWNPVSSCALPRSAWAMRSPSAPRGLNRRPLKCMAIGCCAMGHSSMPCGSDPGTRQRDSPRPTPPYRGANPRRELHPHLNALEAACCVAQALHALQSCSPGAHPCIVPPSPSLRTSANEIYQRIIPKTRWRRLLRHYRRDE